MKLLNAIIPAPYDILVRIAAIVLVVLGAFTTGWIKRGEHDQSIEQSKIIKDQQTIIRIHDTQTIIDTKTVNDLQSKLKTLRKKNDDLQKQIDTIPDNCTLSSEWVHIYNDSIKTNDATPSGRSNATNRTIRSSPN